MKKYNTFKVVLITILVLLVLSWILPAAYYSGQFVDQGRTQMGLYELFNYPLTSLSYFGYIAIFIIFVGGFYGVLYKIPAYRTFLDKIVKLFKGKEKLFLSIVVVLIALGVSVCGLQLVYFLFIPLLVSLILLMGFDKIVVAMVIIGSMAAGLIGTTYSYTNSNMLLSVLSLDFNYQIWVRFIILLLSVILVIINTFMYIKKSNGAVETKKEDIKKNDSVKSEIIISDEVRPAPKKKANNVSKKTTNNNKKTSTKKSSSSKSTKNGSSKSKKTTKNPNKAALKKEDIIVVKESVTKENNDNYLIPTRVEATHKVWPLVTGFIILFILVVLAFMSWGEGGFNISLFTNITSSVSKFELFGFPIFAKIYGTMNAFGTWTVIDLLFPMGLLLLILVLIYGIKFDDVLEGFKEGAIKALYPAFIALLVYSVLVLVTYHPYQLVIYKAVLSLSKGFNIATATFVAILASFFNGDLAYVYQSSLPYFTSVVTNAKNYATVGIIFQSMYGFTMLFAPTSMILMCVLSYIDVSYKDWLKNIWKLLLELFIVLLIVFIILALI